MTDQRRTFGWVRRFAGSGTTSGWVDGVRSSLLGRFRPRFNTMYANLGKDLRLAGQRPAFDWDICFEWQGLRLPGQRLTFGWVKRFAGSRITFGWGDGVRNGLLGKFKSHSTYRRCAGMAY